MARKLRYAPRNGMVEVSLRCTDGEMLLAPEPELQRRVLGVLGRALHLFPVMLHAYQFMSNHLHMLMTVAHAERMARFMGYLAKNGGDAIRELRGTRWVWESRYWHRCIATDREATARLRYILSNGVKEGLVERPEDWPGISSTRALVEQQDILVRWSTAKERRIAARRGESLESVGTPYVIRLEPLPSFAKQDARGLRKILFAMCRNIERDGRILRGGRPALGVDAVRSVDPKSRHPLERRNSNAGASIGRAGRSLDRMIEQVASAHRRATELRRAGHHDAPYPAGCYAPVGRFTPWPEDDPSPRL